MFVPQADEMIELYVPYCQNKMASEELLCSHRTYLCVSTKVYLTSPGPSETGHNSFISQNRIDQWIPRRLPSLLCH